MAAILIIYSFYTLIIYKSTFIDKNEITMATLSFQDKKKFESLMNKYQDGKFTFNEYINTFIEVPVKSEYLNEIIDIINRSKFRGIFLMTFGPKNKISQPDYSIKLYTKKGLSNSIEIWDGNRSFSFREWHTLRKKDMQYFYSILSLIKANSIMDKNLELLKSI